MKRMRASQQTWRPFSSAAFSIVIALAFTSARLAAQPAAEPPAPCGPAADLPAELANNVAADSRCFELRMYSADPTRDGQGQFKGGINELHQRFREQEIELFTRHGAEIVAVWQSLDNPRALVWMLAYRDHAHREEVWAAFNADPDWDALRRKYFVPLERSNVTMMSATVYTPLK
jgi:hypothetical protein